MSDSGLPISSVSSHGVPLRERAFVVGNVIGVNAYRINRTLLKQRLIEGNYQVQETPHFFLALRPAVPTILVHWFAPEAIDADLGHYFMEELKPLGVLEGPQDYGDCFGTVVGSVFPQDFRCAWHLFGINTLQRYNQFLAEGRSSTTCDTPVEVFATLYRRVCELQRGESLLDAGCSFGFLPLVVAEHIPSLTKVLGIDIQTGPFPVARAIAKERNLARVQYAQADLLDENIGEFGSFDTVTALHVLEHFTERDMYRVLTSLLKVTRRRLIAGVPYEPGEPESAYGHEQLFTPDKLEAVGRWCLQQLGGGRIAVEDCAGGLLLVDRPSL
ncbi:MAG: methyltransferase domain-containing protein [Ktedonobacteraceae bacterium]